MKILNIILLSIIVIVFEECSLKPEKKWIIKSPNGNISASISFEIARESSPEKVMILNYRAAIGNNNVIDDSPLGVRMNGEDGNLIENLIFIKEKTTVINESYILPSGKKRVYENKCNELVLTFKNSSGQKMEVVFRAYNDGIAYRYRIPGKGTRIITGEASSFNIPDNSRAWGQPVNEGNCHESQYESGIVGKDFLTDKHPWFPVLFTPPANDFWVLLTEAAVYGEYCGSHFEFINGIYKVVLHDSSVTSSLPWVTPWRVAVIGKTLAPIIETNLIENLNPPSVIQDMSWIKPGRTSWTWWYAGEPNPSEVVDKNEWDKFAIEEMGWEYGCGRKQMWYDWAGNWINSYSYRKRFLESGSLEKLLDQDLKKDSEEGIVILKCDFIDSDSQERMKDYDLIAQTCLKYKIMLNWHGARLPGVERRRLPNMVGCEAVWGAEYYKWSHGPEIFHRLTLPFTRNVVGPMDFTCVTFGGVAEGKRKNSDAAELAIAMLYENGIQYWGAPPKEYRKRPAAMSFLKKCPAAWETTRFVDGYPGEYVCLARQMLKENIWFIGAMANLKKDDVKTVSFSFLPGSRKYELELHSDGKTCADIVTRKIPVTSESSISINILSNGGFCGILKPVDQV